MLTGSRSPPIPTAFSDDFSHDGNSCIRDGITMTTVDYLEIFRTHCTELGRYLAAYSYLASGSPSSSSNTGSKLTMLTIQGYYELSTDVYDELVRRKNEEEVTFLPVRNGFQPKRNPARQELSALPTAQFQDLCRGIHWFLTRRYTDFKDKSPGRGTAAYKYDNHCRQAFRLHSTNRDGLCDIYKQPQIGPAKGSGVFPIVENPDLEPAPLARSLEGFAEDASVSYPAINGVGPDPGAPLVAPLVRINPEDLTGSIVGESLYPVHGGKYADVFRGTLSKDGLTTKVAIKVIRSHTYSEANQRKIDKVETGDPLVVVPAAFKHHPIARYNDGLWPIYSHGLPLDEGREFGPLFKEEETGTRSRTEIKDNVIEGLSYLHAHAVVHGDLTTANILMDDKSACLTDFGLSSVMAEFPNNSLMSSKMTRAPRWAAPELYLVGANTNASPNVTTHCDVYSFGSVALQVISGKMPYGDIASEFVIIIELMKGSNPPRPLELHRPVLESGSEKTTSDK